ncbi:protein PAXX isoform X1 [Accipiter gentilis]|uniref:protein PAXX isoform X1 n=1 Tax=Astur gentilis TaxID=8957 RepID=UPI00210FA4BB|nr:protein PAXX isoform X1 [Accipiter gentilis]
MAEPAGPFHLLQAGPGRYLCYCRPGPGPGGTFYVTDALEVWAGELSVRPPLGCRCRPEEHGTKLREALGRRAVSLSLGEGKATLQPRDEAQCSALDLFKLPVAEARSQLQALVFGMAEHVGSLERRLEVVDTLASSCSPEKNAVWSQQLFLPGRQLPGGTSPLPTACFPSFPQEAAGPVSMCSPGHSESPQLWLLSAAPLFCCPSQHRRGQGSARWLSGCLGYTLLRSHAGHHQAGLLEAHPGLAGLLKQLADLLQSLSCLSLTEADPSPRKNRGAGSALSAKRKIPGESLINPGFKSKRAPSGVDFEDS